MKIKVLILLLSTILIVQNSFGQKKDTSIINSINRLEQRIKNVESKELNEITKSINDINNNISTQSAINEQILNGVSLQIESATYILTIFGLLFAVAAIGLGAYVTYIERKVVRIGDESKTLLSKNQKIKEEVEEINRLIQSDIYNLFLKIKREETVHIIERLTNIPKDIANVGDILLSRELQQEDFSRLKLAYLKLTDDDSHFKDYYKVLFFQHFLNLTLKDEILRNEIVEFIPEAISSAFENDIVKSTHDFTNTLVDYGLTEFSNEISQFFNGLSSSDFNSFEEVYKTLFENLKSRKNRFDLWNIIPTSPSNRLAKINYGILLREKYQNETQSETESLILKELEEIIIVEQQDKLARQQREEEQKKAAEERIKIRAERRKSK